MAVGAEQLTLTWNDDYADFTGQDAFSAVFTLNVKGLPSNDSLIDIFKWSAKEDGSSGTFSYGVKYDGYDSSLYGFAPGKSNGQWLEEITGYETALVGYTYDKEGAADVYIKLISADGKPTDVAPVHFGKVRDAVSFTSLYKHGSVTKIDVYSGKLTESEVYEAMRSLTVPEPTTATLSLLALAGLAARRRRK